MIIRANFTDIKAVERGENPSEFSPEEFTDNVREKIEKAKADGFDGVMWSKSGQRFFHYSNPEELKKVQKEIEESGLGGYDSLDSRGAYEIVDSEASQKLISGE